MIPEEYGELDGSQIIQELSDYAGTSHSLGPPFTPAVLHAAVT